MEDEVKAVIEHLRWLHASLDALQDAREKNPQPEIAYPMKVRLALRTARQGMEDCATHEGLAE